jgi:hypothetical protein
VPLVPLLSLCTIPFLAPSIIPSDPPHPRLLVNSSIHAPPAGPWPTRAPVLASLPFLAFYIHPFHDSFCTFCPFAQWASFATGAQFVMPSPFYDFNTLLGIAKPFRSAAQTNILFLVFFFFD